MAKRTKSATRTAADQKNVFKPELPTLCLVGTSTKTRHFTTDGLRTLCGRPQTVEAHGRSLVYLKTPTGDGMLHPNLAKSNCGTCQTARETGELPASVRNYMSTKGIQARHATKAAATKAEPAVTRLTKATQINTAASAAELNHAVDSVAAAAGIERPKSRLKKDSIAWLRGMGKKLGPDELEKAMTKKVKAAAKPKKAAAKKAAPAPKAKRTAAVAVEGKITSVQDNPKRPGTASFKRYAKYKKGMTIATALKAGVTKADLKWDVSHGFITIKEGK